jgi:hypothetical protein
MGVNTGFCQRDFGQTNEQQRYVIEYYSMSTEFHGKVNSIQTSLIKTTLYSPAVMDFRHCLQLCINLCSTVH